MHLEDAYPQALAIIDKQTRFNETQTKLMMRHLMLPMFFHNWRDAYKLYAHYFSAESKDQLLIAPDWFREAQREAYEKCMPADERDEQALSNYMDPLPKVALAKQIQRSLAPVDFDGLLALHDARKVDYAPFKDNKFLFTAAAALYAIFQKADVKVSDGLIFKIPYDRVPQEFMVILWVYVIVAVLAFICFYLFVLKPKQIQHAYSKAVFESGKALKDSAARQKPRHSFSQRIKATH